MNMLNSIIIEGKVLNKTSTVTVQGNPVTVITIETSRVYKDSYDGTMKEELSKFDVDTFGNLAEMCNRHAKEDRTIRVVGRLTTHDTTVNGFTVPHVSILGEHIEFKS